MKIEKVTNLEVIADLRFQMFEAIGTDSLLIDNFKEETVSEYSKYLQDDIIVHFGCIVENEIVGIAGGILRKEFPSQFFKNYCSAYIMDVFVKDAFRGKGVAKRLVLEVEKWLINKGATVIKLDTSKFGRPLYEKIGYENSIELIKKINK